MKKHGFYGFWLVALFIMIFGLGSFCLAGEKVYDGDYLINSPARLKALSGFTEVTGSLIIGFVPYFIYQMQDAGILINDNALLESKFSLRKIRNLDGLESLTTIGGHLQIGGCVWMDACIGNQKLRDIEGLRNLKSVGGDVEIVSNISLTNIDGLRSLEEIGGSLSISGNPVLKNLAGLNNLTTVGHGVSIGWHIALRHIDGFDNLTSLGGSLTIRKNVVLKDISGINNITSTTYLQIKENPLLQSITGLSQLTHVGDGTYTDSSYHHLYIYENPRLKDISGLDQVTSVDGDLYLYCNNRALKPDLERFKDRLIDEGWTGCWDFTCYDKDSPVCTSAE